MNGGEVTSGELRLNLLLFSVGGVSFAVDAEQVEAMAAYLPEESGTLFRFHELAGFGNRQVSYRMPTVLSLKSSEPGGCRVLVDAMEDIAEYGVDAISPLPALLEPFAFRHGLWGVLKRDNGLTMLVDFQRIASLPV